MLNKYFNVNTFTREQDLVEDLCIEALKVHGIEMKYLPRTLVKDDPLFGEDALSQFNDAISIEMYLREVEGFAGEGDLLTKFNVEIRDQVTFTVAKKRWEQSRSEKLTTEVGYNYLQESASTTTPSRQRLITSADTDSIVLELTANGYNITTERPMEGDLVYEPLSNTLFEIKFVEHEAVFYQMGRLQTYDLRCEIFNYSNEVISTGDSDIDSIQTNNTLDILAYEMLQENNSLLQLEDGGSLLQEYRIEDIDPVANNQYFQSNDPIFGTSAIIDFSEINPFSEVDRY